MKRTFALLAGAATGAAAALLLRRRRTADGALGASAEPDPRAEDLRRKLAEARESPPVEDDFAAAGMAGETMIEEESRPINPAAAMSGGDVEEVRKQIHEEGRRTADDMRRSGDEPDAA